MIAFSQLKLWQFSCLRRFISCHNSLRNCNAFLSQSLKGKNVKLHSHGISTFRCISSAAPEESKLEKVLPVHSAIVGEGFVPIYKFPYIVQAQLVCRMKIIQTAITVIFLPVYYNFSEITPSSLQLALLTGAGALAVVMLGIMGEIFRKFVGIVYLNPNSKQVCISHLTFLGKRQNAYFELGNIMPISDYESNLQNIALKLRIYSNPKISYWISLRHGEVLNDDFFYEVFGCLPSK